jgi:galactonate dehydratase
MSRSRRSFIKKIGLGSAASAALFTNFGSELQAAVGMQSLNSSPGDLKITRISSAYMLKEQRKMFVKIETNQGITGYGEGEDAVIGTYYLVKYLGQQLIGKTPVDVNRLFDELRRTGACVALKLAFSRRMMPMMGQLLIQLRI